jgi:hypothetical protein
MIKQIVLISSMLNFTCMFSCFAQNNYEKTDDFGRIIINTFIPEEIIDSPPVRNLLSNKLDQITTRYGIGGSNLFTRFIITPKISVVSKDITRTAPIMTALNLSVTIFIGDGIDGTKFSNENIELKGVGTNETKAYINAIKQINTRNNRYEELISKAKVKIIEYYNSRCDFILKEAETLSNQREFSSAISNLFSIPEVCKECYDKAMDLSSEIFKKKLEFECQVNLTNAKAEIAKDNYEIAADFIAFYTPDLSCFNEVEELLKKIEDHKCSKSMGKANGAWGNMNSVLAAKYLSEVAVDSKCSAEAEALALEISNKLKADEKKEWDLAYEKYNRDMDYKEKQGFELEKSRINAMREIGIEKYKNQPQNINYYNIRTW